MERTRRLALGLMVSIVVGSFASPGMAHGRDYVVAYAVAPPSGWLYGTPIDAALVTCFDAWPPVAVPDYGGTCFRAGHVQPNLNGDATISVLDQTQSNVGLRLCQERIIGNGACGLGELVWQGCNSGTFSAHVSWDPSLDLWVWIDDLWRGSSASPGFAASCGAGVDSFGTIGTVNHS